MNWKTEKEMVAGTKTHAARIALASTKAITAACDAMERQGRPLNVIGQATGRLAEAMIADVREANMMRRNALREAIAREETAYRRALTMDTGRRDATEREVRRFRAMDGDELRAAAKAMEQALLGGAEVDPEVIDALSAELKPADPDRHIDLRAVAKQTGSHRPWERTETGRAIMDELRVTEQAVQSGAIPVNVDGRWGTVSAQALMDGGDE